MLRGWKRCDREEGSPRVAPPPQERPPPPREAPPAAPSPRAGQPASSTARPPSSFLCVSSREQVAHPQCTCPGATTTQPSCVAHSVAREQLRELPAHHTHPPQARPRALTRTHTPCAGLLFAQSVRRGSSSPRRGRAPSTSSPPWPQRVRSSWELRGSGVRGWREVAGRAGTRRGE